MNTLRQLLNDPIGNWIVGAIISGAFASLVASVIFYLIQYTMKPKIQFSKDIAFNNKEGDNDIYQIKIKNVGKREIIDIKIEVKLMCKVPIPEGRVHSTINLNLNRSYLVLLDTYNKEALTGHFTITFGLTDEDFIEKLIKENRLESILSNEYLAKLKTFEVTLEDLLRYYDELRCYVIATDPLSGTSKIYRKNYTKSNIEVGAFIAGTLEIKRKNQFTN